MFACCLSQHYGLQIIWQFWHVNNRQISGAGVLFTAFSDFFNCQNTEILSKFHIKSCVIRFLTSI